MVPPSVTRLTPRATFPREWNVILRKPSHETYRIKLTISWANVASNAIPAR